MPGPKGRRAEGPKGRKRRSTTYFGFKAEILSFVTASYAAGQRFFRPFGPARKCSFLTPSSHWLFSVRREVWLLSEDLRLALFQHQHAITYARSSGGNAKALERLIHRLVRETEGPVMHGNHGLCFQIQESLQRVFWAGVDIAIVRRMIGADREQCQFGMQPAPNLPKTMEVRSVTGVI